MRTETQNEDPRLPCVVSSVPFRRPCSPLQGVNFGSPPSESELVPRKGARKLIYMTRGRKGPMHNLTQTSWGFWRVQEASGPRKEGLPLELRHWRWRMAPYNPNLIASPPSVPRIAKARPLAEEKGRIRRAGPVRLVVLLGTCSGK